MTTFKIISIASQRSRLLQNKFVGMELDLIEIFIWHFYEKILTSQGMESYSESKKVQ